MAHTGIFFTKAELDVAVGENVDVTGYTEANINAVCKQIESYINVATRHNYSDDFAGVPLNTDVKHLLGIAAVTLAATIFITYNMAGYTSRIEAENMINVNLWIHKKTMGLLFDQKSVTFINGA